MKTISLDKLEADPGLYKEVTGVLGDGGLVCLPCANTYRLLADLTSAVAVERLLQSKSRTRKAPALVFVDSERMLEKVAAEVGPEAKKIVHGLWPAPVTILFDLHPELPRKVVKQLSRGKDKVGVRMPNHPVIQRVVSAFGRPLLASSANKERKHGAGSPAQIRKNFARRLDLFVDAGDLPPAPSSTIVEVVAGKVEVTRAGVIASGEIDAVIG